MGEETRAVKDLVVERGINVSVIVQTLLLASTIGFGTSIITSLDKLTYQVARLNTYTEVNRSGISNNTDRIGRLEDDVREYKLECSKGNK
ncbi:hypothetical protein OAO19_02985 [Gammaproteobacteria bacterium]|nr:hypothetical protein [Gammaproteobacteria bacterium]